MGFPRLGQKKPRGTAGANRRSGEGSILGSRTQRLRRAVILAAFLVIVVAITPRLTPGTDMTHGDINFRTRPQDDILAEFKFESEDLAKTREARDKAAESVPDRYYLSQPIIDKVLAQLEERIEALRGQADAVDSAIRDALLASNSNQDASQVVTDAVLGQATALRKNDPRFQDFSSPSELATWLTPDPRCVPERRFQTPAEAEGGIPGPLPVNGLSEPEITPLQFAHMDRLTELSKLALTQTLALGILDPAEMVGKDKESRESPIVILGSGSSSEGNEPGVRARDAVPLPAHAQTQLLPEEVKKAVQALAGTEVDAPVNWEVLSAAACEMAKSNVVPTLAFDESATLEARGIARSQVAPIMRTIFPDDIIQQARQPWEIQTIEDYKTYIKIKNAGQKPVASLLSVLAAHMILAGLVLACLVRSIPLVTLRSQDVFRNFKLTLVIMCGTIVLGRVISIFEPTGLVVPAAAGAILLAILTNARLGAWVGILTAALLSILFAYSWRVFIVDCSMSLAGVSSIAVVRRRSDITSAAFKATLAGLLAMGAISLATDSLFGEEGLRQLTLVGLNGMLCLLFVPGLLSPLERLFRITTDFQLLEYSDLNNEVLGRMAVEIPATYAHALMLGQLAEAASVSIGANGLLARVCAYYHDIGKMRRPEYFSENQTGVNVHDDMSPRLSARAIASHVSEGAEMAREFHLPKPIIDGIRQHHGTCLISFFYQEALTQQKHGDVEESDFRYPGPKPQSREVAILMICDAVESGVRSIRNPNEERIRELVDKIITSRADDRQFDECDLTLKELDTIRDVLTKRLLTTLHRRIAYPDQFPENQASNVIPMPGGAEK